MAQHPVTIDALFSDRIRLLQHDPERYFELYPRLTFGEIDSQGGEDRKRRKRRWSRG